MTLIRRLVPALACLVLALPAAAQSLGDFVPFSTLKTNSEGLVQEALGVLPTSELGGTLNRISALNNRQPIRDLRAAGTGDPSEEELPDSYERGMEAAILDLRDDLQAAIDAYDAGEWDCVETSDPAGPADGSMDCREAMFVLLQLVKHAVVDGDLTLFPSGSIICVNTHTGERCDAPITRDVDHVTTLLVNADWFTRVDSLLDERPVDPGSPAPFERARAVDYEIATNQFILRATGVEEIQYERATGVPSIDS